MKAKQIFKIMKPHIKARPSRDMMNNCFFVGIVNNYRDRYCDTSAHCDLILKCGGFIPLRFPKELELPEEFKNSMENSDSVKIQVECMIAFDRWEQDMYFIVRGWREL